MTIETSETSEASRTPRVPQTRTGGLSVDAPPQVITSPGPEPVPANTLAPLRPFYLPGAMLTIAGLLALTFVADVAVLGAVRHARDQSTSFDTLRGQLATATAPVSQVDEDGRLLELGTPLGVLDVPQIGLREVYFEGTTSAVLMSGPGHRRDTPMPGQAGVSVIMGRQAGYGGPFAYLEQVQPGMVLTVTTGQGVAAYRIIGVRREGDAQPAPPTAGQGRLTLVTASGPQFRPDDVVRVDADLATPVQPSGARPLSSLYLPQAEKPMQGESGAWLMVVLWAQLLLLAAAGVTWARYRWGRWQTWLAGGPVLAAVAFALWAQLARALPNLL